MKNAKQHRQGKKIMKLLGVIFAIYTAFCIGLLICLHFCSVNSAVASVLAGICLGLWGAIPLFWIGYGIYQIATTEKTIPKVKERMPWDKGNPLSVDDEWRQAIKENTDRENEE